MTHNRSHQAIRSILCAVDFGPQSRAALRSALDLARREGGHVTALHVGNLLFETRAAATGYDTERLRASTLAELRRFVGRLAKGSRVRSGTWSVETLNDRPAEGILAFARSSKADLIVMGTHGRRGSAKLLLGSVAKAVLRRARVPVLVVQGGRPAALGPRRRILGAIELGPQDRGDARRIAAAAKKVGGSLTLLHVVSALSSYPSLASRRERQRFVAAEARLAKLAREIRADFCVALGEVADRIPAAARSAKADIVVLVLRPRRGLFGARQGTMTYRVLCEAGTPVLALPPRRS